MHEHGLTEHLLGSVLAEAKAAREGRVTDVFVVIGERSGVAEEAIRQYWDDLCQGTPAEGAVLHVRHEPSQLRCLACGATSPAPEVPTGCPMCRSWEIDLSAGDASYLEAIETAAGTGPDASRD